MIKLLSNKILVEPKELEEKTPAGIYLPDIAKEKSWRGVVLAVGPGLRDADGNITPTEAKPGDEIMFYKAYAKEIHHDGKDLVIVNSEDVLAFIEE